MEANQALISLSGSREDLDIEVDKILGKSVWKVYPLQKRKEIYNTLQKIYRTDQDRLLEQPSCHWRQITLGATYVIRWLLHQRCSEEQQESS